MPQRSEKIIFNLKNYTLSNKYEAFSVMHKQKNYYHTHFLTKLFKTESKPKLNFVVILPYLLYCINFCFHYLDKIYSQKEETEKRKVRERRKSLTWILVKGLIMSLGKKCGWGRNRAKTQPYVISKSKIFLKIFKEPKWSQKKSESTHTQWHTHRQRPVMNKPLSFTTTSNSATILYMQCKFYFPKQIKSKTRNKL